ncbi:MAG: hypothetical protein ACLFSC_09885 [Wenzhouxiangella sp.]
MQVRRYNNATSLHQDLNMRAPSFLTILVSAICLLIVAVGNASAQSNASIADSGLFFSVLGPDNGLFSVASVDSGTDVVRYQLGAESQVVFRLADQDQGMFDNPLFCFDFDNSGDAAVTLEAENSSGQVILGGIGLVSDLDYQVSGGEILLTPSDSTQCFYVGTNDPSEEASFGLFGVAPSSTDTGADPDDLVFSDRFEVIENSSVSVSFEGVPDSVAASDSFSYDVLIQNTGDVALDQLAFQEVFPGNATYFPAALDAGTWDCAGTSCPATTGTGPIRLDSVALPAGESIRYTVSRTVDAGSTGGSTIVMYAGAVDGPGQDATFDVDRVDIPVVGAPETVQVVFVDEAPLSVVEGEPFPDFEVRVLDVSGLLVSNFTGTAELSLRGPDGPIEFLDPSALSISGGVGLATGIVVPNGSAGPDRFLRADVTDLDFGDSEPFDVQASAGP